MSGGLIRSLNKNVPYTNSAKPTICSHLNVSHPRPRDTIQMKRVLQVSMIDLAVALSDLVIDKPKKLKPPILIMMRTEDTAMDLCSKTWR